MKCQLVSLNMLSKSADCHVVELDFDRCINCSWYINNKLMEKKRTTVKRFVPMNEKDYKINDSVGKINHKYNEERKRVMKISQLW